MSDTRCMETMADDAKGVSMDDLEAENARLRAALKPFAEVADEYDDREDDDFEVWKDAGPIQNIRATFRLSMYRAARAALG